MKISLDLFDVFEVQVHVTKYGLRRCVTMYRENQIFKCFVLKKMK